MPKRSRAALIHPSVLSLVLIVSACEPTPPAAPEAELRPATSVAAAVDSTPDDRPVILAFGDSLTDGYGIDPRESYPAQLQVELDRKGYSYRVVNQGISGDTTSGGLARLSLALELKPAIVILELGGNDGLRGVPIDVARENLGRMIEAFQEIDSRVVIAGLTLPMNYGPDYISEFENMFVELAETYGTERIPFLLEGVAGDPELNRSGDIHPTAEGYAIVVRNVLETIEPLIQP